MFETIVDDIIKHIEWMLQKKKSIIVAIDGRCAAGKTTLAACLQKSLDCSVLHMDDFFLRPEQRTKERLEVPGGNVDYERFLKEVLVPLSNGQACSYRPFDCKSQSLQEPVAVNLHTVTIIEGSYSCHPKLYEYCDLHIFLDVDEEIQKERILLRNGKENAQMFFVKWIPLEEKYFNAYQIKEMCELLFSLI